MTIRGLEDRLSNIPDKIFADEIQNGLKTKFIGREIFYYNEIDSTNDAALKLGEVHAKEGVCVFAEYQKKGRGRFGRSWISPKGKNILMSILFRPMKFNTARIPQLTLTTAVSIIKVIYKMTRKKFGIKWPNDIVYHDEKVCGILTEMKQGPGSVPFVVVGIGVNVNAERNELPAKSISLKEITEHPHSRQKLARNFLEEIETDYVRLRNGDFASLAKEWENFSATSGKCVKVTLAGRTVQGEAMGIDAEGALWVRKDNGLQERILAGDVEHLR